MSFLITSVGTICVTKQNLQSAQQAWTLGKWGKPVCYSNGGQASPLPSHWPSEVSFCCFSFIVVSVISLAVIVIMVTKLLNHPIVPFWNWINCRGAPQIQTSGKTANPVNFTASRTSHLLQLPSASWNSHFLELLPASWTSHLHWRIQFPSASHFLGLPYTWISSPKLQATPSVSCLHLIHVRPPIPTRFK